MQEQFDRLGLQAEWFDAITPDDLSAQQIADHCNPLAAFSMTKRQYCCNQSHLMAWRKFLETGEKAALFLEDDALLSSSLPRFLTSSAVQSVDVLRLETWPSVTSPFARDSVPSGCDGITFRTCLKRDAGSAGYILSRHGAEVFSRDDRMNRRLVDGLLFDPFNANANSLAMRYVYPGLAIQLYHVDPAKTVSMTSIGGKEDDEFYTRKRLRSIKARTEKQLMTWREYDLPRARAAIIRTAQGVNVDWLSIPFVK